ncbi:MAG: hypothetical protein ACYC6L_06745 [Anaerolineae bacterium]
MQQYNLVAFTSLPIGLRGGSYELTTPKGQVNIIVTDLHFNPFVTLTSQPHLAKALPQNGQGEGFISYTWYDHPFVLRVAFGPGVASLGSINSLATIVQRLDETLEPDSSIFETTLYQDFAQNSLEAFNFLIGVMRRKSRLYHLHDLMRSDVQITVRDEAGIVKLDDPLEGQLAREETEQSTSTFDLSERNAAWYQDLRNALLADEPVDLADELLMEAEHALSERFPRQALATCHSVLETAVSNLLTIGMTKRGLASSAIDDLLLSKSLAAKLDSLLETYTSYSLKRHNRQLWTEYVRFSDIRNDIVHRGHNPSHADAEFALQVTRDIMAWLNFVRSRLKGITR